MIELSNGHRFEFVAASGSLGFDGRGWPWEWPLRWLGLLDPRLFTIVTKTLLLYPWNGNLERLPLVKIPKFWKVLKFISKEGEVIPFLLALLRPSLVGGVANAVGLNGPGIKQWLEKDYPTIQRLNYKVILSITGEESECLEMVRIVNELENIVGIEFNASCPSFNQDFLENSQKVIDIVRAIAAVSKHPLILKLGYTQNYCQIAKEIEGFIGAIDINAVPWEVVFPDKESPLARYGGGGVSGPIAKIFTWETVSELAKTTTTPIIGPSIWEYADIDRLHSLGASACHFGTIFLPYPWKPTKYVQRWIREQK